jgi:hypothetical protein
MPEMLSVQINGKTVEVTSGTSIAAAMLIVGECTRVSVSGGPRTAVCGMGICFECRAIVNGIPHRRTCQLLCEVGMTIETDR